MGKLINLAVTFVLAAATLGLIYVAANPHLISREYEETVSTTQTTLMKLQKCVLPLGKGEYECPDVFDSQSECCHSVDGEVHECRPAKQGIECCRWLSNAQVINTGDPDRKTCCVSNNQRRGAICALATQVCCKDEDEAACLERDYLEIKGCDSVLRKACSSGNNTVQCRKDQSCCIGIDGSVECMNPDQICCRSDDGRKASVCNPETQTCCRDEDEAYCVGRKPYSEVVCGLHLHFDCKLPNYRGFYECIKSESCCHSLDGRVYDCEPPGPNYLCCSWMSYAEVIDLDEDPGAICCVSKNGLNGSVCNASQSCCRDLDEAVCVDKTGGVVECSEHVSTPEAEIKKSTTTTLTQNTQQIEGSDAFESATTTTLASMGCETKDECPGSDIYYTCSSQGNVVRNTRTYRCVDGLCVDSVVTRVQEACDFSHRCVEGTDHCVEE